ncbi:MAG TPA: HD domain-containing phosphohydrolase [Acidobacteriaceae bacterium]|jgi:ActR/RegA family two-component response regulator
MKPKILLVDDEPAVLAGYERTLYREFEIETATGGEAGLQALEQKGPFAVVVSDMRMPGMSGAQFLTKVREQFPESVRILFTGYTDITAAIEAINHGNIFRFLTKPASKEVLVSALWAGIAQYDLIRAEKDLLEKTLVSSIKVLADFLNVSSPQAFGRSSRIAGIVKHIAGKLQPRNAWRWEAAAMLSQLGCIALEPELLQKSFSGAALSPDEKARFETHPGHAMRMLKEIPRLELVAWMIGHQLTPELLPQPEGITSDDVAETLLGTKALRLALAFDELRARDTGREEVIQRLMARTRQFDAAIIATLADYTPDAVPLEPRRIAAVKVVAGMVLDQDVFNRDGVLLIPKGQQISAAMQMKIQNFAQAFLIDRELQVLAPAQAA